MKKALTLLMLAALMLSATACGDKDESEKSDKDSGASATTTTTAATTPAADGEEGTPEDDGKGDLIEDEGDADTEDEGRGDLIEDEGDGDSGDDELLGDDMSFAEGTWRLDGEADTAFIDITADGGFVSYYASGAVEASGYIEQDPDIGSYLLINGEDDSVFTEIYFDSETEFHTGNGVDNIYILVGEGGTTEGHGVLVNPTPFTGLSPLDATDDFYGGFYEAFVTEDGLTAIINCGVPFDIYAAEDYQSDVLDMLVNICGAEPENYKEVGIGDMDGNLAFNSEWTTTINEMEHYWMGQFVITDDFMYLYAFDTTPDNFEEMYDTFFDALKNITLEYF